MCSFFCVSSSEGRKFKEQTWEGATQTKSERTGTQRPAGQGKAWNIMKKSEFAAKCEGHDNPNPVIKDTHWPLTSATLQQPKVLSTHFRRKQERKNLLFVAFSDFPNVPI